MIIGGNPGQAKSTLRSCASEKCTQRGQALRHISNTAVGRPACARDAEPPSSLLFSVLQALLILSALQPSIFSVLASGGQIACSPPFSSKIRSQVMNCHLLILESFLITVLTRIYYRRKDDKLGYEPFSSPDQDLNLKA